MRGKNKYRNDGQKDTYQVRTGDNWFSIAEQIYGDQRMAGLLMEANTGISALHQGQVIYLPALPALEPVEAVFFSQTKIEAAVDSEDELKDASTPGNEEMDLPPEDWEEIARVVAEAMDAMEEGEEGSVIREEN